MAVLFLIGVFVAYPAEQEGNPMLSQLGIESSPSADQPGGNMEGKETRFGIAASALFATVTTDASSGAVNSMHDSYTPLGGLVPLRGGRLLRAGGKAALETRDHRIDLGVGCLS